MKKERTSKLPEALRKTLSRYRRRRQLVTAQRGLFLTLVILTTSVGLALALDRLLRLDPLYRKIFLGVIAATALWLLLTRVIIPAFRRMSYRRAAASLGDYFPEMKEDLLSGVELSGMQNGEAEEGVSHSLIVSAINHIAERAAKIDPRLAVSVRPILKIGGIFVLVTLLLGLAYLLHPKPFEDAFNRLLQPDRHTEFFTYTRIAVRPGNHIIRTGDSIDISITTSGRPVDVAYIRAKKKSGPLRVKFPCMENKATWKSAPLFEDLKYRVYAGDARSDEYMIRVVPPPALQTKAAVLFDPEYAGRTEREIPSIQGPLQIVRGTALKLRVKPVDRGEDEKFACEAELVCPAEDAEVVEEKGVDWEVQPDEFLSPWPQLEAKLDKYVAFDYTNKLLSEVVDDLSKQADAPFTIDPEAEGNLANTRITFAAVNIKLDHALDWLVSKAGLQYTLRNETIFISNEERIGDDQWVSARVAVKPRRVKDWRPFLKHRMQQRVTFDFKNTPLQEAVAFLQKNTKITYVLNKEAVKEQRNPRVTLNLEKMGLIMALDSVVEHVGLKYMLLDEAIYISSKKEIEALAALLPEEDGPPYGEEDSPAEEEAPKEPPAEAKRLPMARDEHGWLCTEVFTAEFSGEYLVELVDGYGLRNKTPQAIYITLLEDKTPRVAVTNPARDVTAMSSEAIPVEITAEDELGLRGVDLTYRLGRGIEPRVWDRRRIRMKLKEGGIQVRKLTVTTELDVSEFGLAPGDVIEYRAEAADYADTEEMRRSHSPPYRIVVISELQHLQSALDRLKDVRIELLKRALDQEVDAGEFGQMAGTAKEDPVNDEARTAQDQQRELARNVNGIARSVDMITPDLLRNPSAPIDLLSDLEKLGRGIRAVATGPMSTTADHLGHTANVPPRDADRADLQRASLLEAQRTGTESAIQLRLLAAAAARMLRSSALFDLADQADLLAARQWEVQHSTLKVGIKTIGALAKDLPREMKLTIGRLQISENAIHSGIKELEKGIKEAASDLAYAEPEQAAAARRAGKKLRGDAIVAMSAAVAKNLKRNILFSEIPRQGEVAFSLEEIATILRGEESSGMSSIVTQLQEFINRQITINTSIITSGIYKKATTQAAQVVGGKQRDLERDVLEQASALEWLTIEFAAFEIKAPRRLQAAAGEMRAGAKALDSLDFPQGLKHGKEALTLLMNVIDEIESVMMEEDFENAWHVSMSLEGLLMLSRVLKAQRRLVADSTEAEELEGTDFNAFTITVINLAEKQSAIRVNTLKLKNLLAAIPGSSILITGAAEKMDISRQALDAGDAGHETRVVQRQAIALLERLMGDTMEGMVGMMMGNRAAAMAGFMSNGGGFRGGGNAPILPAATDEMDRPEWTGLRTLFEGQLASGFDSEYPPKFRKLLEAYFGKLRNEPRR